MSGHSKWKNIMHKKSKTDAARAKIFTKLGREIMVAVKAGGPDPSVNSRLYDVIAKCKAANMPNDNIKKGIEKASGNMDASNYEQLTYEGYGPSGVAVMVETLTDNKNRTAGEVRHYFDKFGGNLGTTGCVGFMFEQFGVILIEKADNVDEDELTMAALDLGALDFVAEDEFYEIKTAPAEFSGIAKGLEEGGYTFLQAEVQMVPSTMTKLDNADDVTKMERLIDALEDNDDVQNVWHNWDEE